MICSELFLKFFSIIESDQRINTAHVSLYMVLLFYLIKNNNENPIAITRSQLLNLSKTGRTTYQKCIKELHQYGYIKYVPSFDRKGRSSFYLHIITFYVMRDLFLITL